MILKGYIDESISKNQRFFTLSALIGIGEEWIALSTEWEALLQAENDRLRLAGRRTLRRYHAAECNAHSEDFEGWSGAETIAFTKKMLEILDRHPMKTISYSLDLKAMSEEIGDADLIGSSYSLCTNLLIHRIGKWLQEKEAGPMVRITLFHDRCDYDLVVLEQFNNLVESASFEARGHFVTIAPMGWEDCIPLQPADLMAYENMRDAKRRSTRRRCGSP